MALYNPTSVNALQKTLAAALLSGATASATLNNATNIVNGLGACVIDRVDANGASTAAKREYITFTGTSGSTITGLTRNADGGGSDQDHAVGAIVEFVNDVVQAKAVKDVIETDHTTAGDHKLTAYDNVNAPQGFLLNGKIVPSVASNNLTVAIKGLNGNNPSAANPVYCRIGDTIRSITSAFSTTAPAGTNYFLSGSAELATKEIDYFVYLAYNTTDGIVRIAFSRIPYANIYSDFGGAWTGASEKRGFGNSTNMSASDPCELIGRFAATLSAGAGYTWTVPTFTTKNLIQRPIYETRTLDFVPTLTGTGLDVGTSTYLGKYSLVSNRVWFQGKITLAGITLGTGTDWKMYLPFTVSASDFNDQAASFYYRDSGSLEKQLPGAIHYNVRYIHTYYNTSLVRVYLAYNLPITFANSDKIQWSGNYLI